MTTVLIAVAPGPLVTIQDAGRKGWRRFGVASAGAMDRPAMAIGNALVGNPADEAVLEFAQAGGRWEVRGGTCRLAIVGGSFGVEVDGRSVPAWRSLTLRDGQSLRISPASDASWGYIAVAGGLQAEPQLGSRSTHMRSGLGGVHGSRLEAGDVLALRLQFAPAGPEREVAAPRRQAGPIRVVLGPQDHYFSPDAIAAFLGSAYQVDHRCDRMGCWLGGPALTHTLGYNIVSDGVVPGCVQVPGSGQPVVLLMDCQTIGGYPKLATVVSADLPRFAQMMRPGNEVRFAAVSVDEAQHIARERTTALQATLAEIAAVETRRPFWLLPAA